MIGSLRALALGLLVGGCGETSLGALRPLDASAPDAPADVGPDEKPARLPPLRCGERFASDRDAVDPISSEVRVRLEHARDLGVVDRWSGGDALLDGGDANLLLPGGSCADGAAIVGFREGLATREIASGTGCVAGLTRVSTIELGHNNNVRGACVHGELGGAARSQMLRLHSDYWRPVQVRELAAGEGRCAFGPQTSAVVYAAADGARWSQLLDEDNVAIGSPVSLSAADARLSPLAAFWVDQDKWALWATADARWFAERMLFSGGTYALSSLDDVLGGRDASALLDAESVPGGVVAFLRDPRGWDGAVGAMLLCPDQAPHLRRLTEGTAVAARLVARGEGYALVWQTDDGDGVSRLWVSEFDPVFVTRTPRQLIVEGVSLALVALVGTKDPSELVLWYAQRRPEGGAMLRTGRLSFGF